VVRVYICKILSLQPGMCPFVLKRMSYQFLCVYMYGMYVYIYINNALSLFMWADNIYNNPVSRVCMCVCINNALVCVCVACVYKQRSRTCVCECINNALSLVSVGRQQRTFADPLWQPRI
jgi:hypothetical protein